MKLCKFCGTPQNNSRHICIECGRILGRPLSKEQDEAWQESTEQALQNAVYHTDIFCVTKKDRILSVIGIVLFLAALVLFSCSLTELNQRNDARLDAIQNAILSGNAPSVIISGTTGYIPPSREDYLRVASTAAAAALVCLAAAIPMMCIPRTVWALETLHVRIRYHIEPDPSALDEWVFKHGKYIIFVIGSAAAAVAAWMYF